MPREREAKAKPGALLLCQTEAMTPTTTLSRYMKNVFEAVAKERGISFEEVAALYPDPTDELLEELEDEVDAADAERILANSDPTQRKTLDDLRKAWNL